MLNGILKNMDIKIKEMLDYYYGNFIFRDEKNDLYSMGVDESGQVFCTKINGEIKIKELLGEELDCSTGIYFKGFDNKVYILSDVGTENVELKIALYSEDKIITGIPLLPRYGRLHCNNER